MGRSVMLDSISRETIVERIRFYWKFICRESFCSKKIFFLVGETACGKDRILLKYFLSRNSVGKIWSCCNNFKIFLCIFMAKQKQDNQLEPTYSSSVRIRDVALKTCQKRWTIGRSGERGSGISVLASRHNDDDDIYRLQWN